MQTLQQMERVQGGVLGAKQVREHLLQALGAPAELPDEVSNHGPRQVSAIPQVNADRGLHHPVLPWAATTAKALEHLIVQSTVQSPPALHLSQ